MAQQEHEEGGIANIIEARNRYRRIRSRKERTAFITEMQETFKMSRKYAIALLRRQGKGTRKRRGAPGKLSGDDISIIHQLWVLSDYTNAEYFQAGIERWLTDLEEQEGYILPREQKERIISVSYKTIWRALKPWRGRRQEEKPNTVRRLSEECGVELVERVRKVDRSGYMCMDTVAHGGRSTAGSFMWSVTWTDVYTGYTLNYAVWNTSYEEMCKAFDYFWENTPFKILSINVDNGREFFNRQALAYWTREKGVKVTHTRPMMKNDNAHAEQRNRTHVRGLFGRYRIDERSDVRWANLIYMLNNPKYNYIIPCKVLVNREVRGGGSRYRRVYDKPSTPSERLLRSAYVTEGDKGKIRETAARSNIVKVTTKLKVIMEKFYSRLKGRANMNE